MRGAGLPTVAASTAGSQRSSDLAPHAPAAAARHRAAPERVDAGRRGPSGVGVRARGPSGCTELREEQVRPGPTLDQEAPARLAAPRGRAAGRNSPIGSSPPRRHCRTSRQQASTRGAGREEGIESRSRGDGAQSRDARAFSRSLPGAGPGRTRRPPRSGTPKAGLLRWSRRSKEEPFYLCRLNRLVRRS